MTDIQVLNGKRLQARLSDFSGAVGVKARRDGGLDISYFPTGNVPPAVGGTITLGSDMFRIREVGRSDANSRMQTAVLDPVA